MRMFCGSCFFLVSLPFHDTGTFRTKLYATVGMNCIINTAVTRAKTPQHLRICGIDNLVAAQRGDIALPEIQSGLLPLKILICPVETTLMLISDRWKVLLIRDLLTGTKRFSELKKSVGKISQKVLTSNLRSMEESGLVSRKVYPEVPPRVEYSLTKTGWSLKPILDAMVEWGTEYKQKHENEKEPHSTPAVWLLRYFIILQLQYICFLRQLSLPLSSARTALRYHA